MVHVVTESFDVYDVFWLCPFRAWGIDSNTKERKLQLVLKLWSRETVRWVSPLFAKLLQTSPLCTFHLQVCKALSVLCILSSVLLSSLAMKGSWKDGHYDSLEAP